MLHFRVGRPDPHAAVHVQPPALRAVRGEHPAGAPAGAAGGVRLRAGGWEADAVQAAAGAGVLPLSTHSPTQANSFRATRSHAFSFFATVAYISHISHWHILLVLALLFGSTLRVYLVTPPKAKKNCSGTFFEFCVFSQKMCASSTCGGLLFWNNFSDLIFLFIHLSYFQFFLGHVAV